jgi:hypothetical protein
MTTVLTFKCDACGEPMGTSRTSISITREEVNAVMAAQRESQSRVDACGLCAAKVIAAKAAELAAAWNAKDDTEAGSFVRWTLKVERETGAAWTRAQEMATEAAKSY